MPTDTAPADPAPTAAVPTEPDTVDADLALARGALADAAADGHVTPGEPLLKLLARSGRRAAVVVAGFALLALGVVLIPLPGPGALVIFAGLALLAREFVWAERLLHRAKSTASQGASAAKRFTRRRRAS